MAKASLKDQPLTVQAAVFVTFFNAWVLFDELVVDRHDLWRYLPFYKVGLFCVWDVLALAVIGFSLFIRFARSPRSDENSSAARERWVPSKSGPSPSDALRLADFAHGRAATSCGIETLRWSGGERSA